MVHYKLYTMAGDRIESAQDLDCVNDTEALQQALALDPTISIEVWQGARKVGAIKPNTDRRRTSR